MRLPFRLRRDAAPGAAGGVLRRIPALPADWQEPPTPVSERDFPATAPARSSGVPGRISIDDLPLRRLADGLPLHEPVEARECGRWQRAKEHDQHTWQHRDIGYVICPGYRPLT